MEEKRTGGVKQFIFAVIWAVIILFIGRGVIVLLPEYKALGTVATLIMFCILGFYVMTRYCAVYTYSLKNSRFRVNRKIGGRNKEVEFALSGVKSVTRKRPPNAPRALHMRTTVFSKKDLWYIVYKKNKEDNLLVCTISNQMADKIRRELKHAK